MTGEIPKKLFIFDSPTSPFVQQAFEGAQKEGWASAVFQNPHDLIGHFDDSVGAILATFEPRYEVFPPPPTMRILDLLNRWGTPRMLVSDHEEASKYLREGTLDSVVPMSDLTPEVISGWLTKLVEVT